MYGAFAYGEQTYGGAVPQVDDRQAVDAYWVAAVRFTVGGVSYAIATDDVDLSGTFHEGRLLDAESLSPTEFMPEGFGLASPDDPSFSIVDDDARTYRAILDADDLDGAAVTVEIATFLTLEDGGQRTVKYKRKVTLDQASTEQGVIRVELKGLEDEPLETEYPTRRFNVDDFPGLHENHVGMPVCEVFGLAVQVPGVYLSTGGGSGPWQIAFCLAGPPTVDASGSDDGVLTLYRDRRIVDPSEYTLKTVASADASFSVLVAEFTQQQLKSDLSLYEFSADVRDSGTTRSSNPVTESAHLMGQVGLTVDVMTRDLAANHVDALGIETGGAHGRDGTRTVRAILNDLAVPARIGLVRAPDGSYRFLQHRPMGNVKRLYDEDAMELVQVDSWVRRSRAKSVAVQFGTSPRDTSKLLHEVRRPVTNGAVGERKAVRLPYVQDFTTADRTAAFLEKMEQYNREAEVLVGFETTLPLDVLSVRSDVHFSGARLLRVMSAEQVPAGSAFVAKEYHDDLFGYTASTPPSSASTGYEPDYSHTPPEAPTNLTVVGAGTFVAEDGTVRAWLELSADEPLVNFQYLEFQLRNKSDDTLKIERASDDNDDGTWTFKFPNLNPNVTYEWHAYAVNPENVPGFQKGIVAAQDVNTAQAAAPDAPTNLAATAKSGLTELTWTNPTNDDFDEIEVHRSTSSSFTPDATTLIAEETGEKHNDVTGTPGTLYFYKVKAVSTSELTSTASGEVSATFKGVTGDGVSKDAPASLAGIGMTVGSSQTYQDAQGNSFARVRLDLTSIPSDSLRSFVQIKHRKGTSGNYRLDDQVSPGSGSVSVWVDDLLPNVAYDFAAVPVSHFGIAGTIKNISATTPKDNTAPSAPTGLAAVQGSARQISVTWDENSENDLLDYELQEKTGVGSFNTIYQGLATGKTVRISSYTQRTYRVRARDTSKNSGGWSLEVTETPDENIDYRDITTGGVRTGNYQDSSVTAIKRQDVNQEGTTVTVPSPGTATTGSWAINADKTPLAVGGGFNTSAKFLATVYSAGFNTIDYWYYVSTDGIGGGSETVTGKWW